MECEQNMLRSPEVTQGEVESASKIAFGLLGLERPLGGTEVEKDVGWSKMA